MPKHRDPIRWTLRDAEVEFPVQKETLAKRLLKLSIPAGEDGKYSTVQICAAVFGDYQGEKTRLAKEQADQIAIKNAAARKVTVFVEDALEIQQRFCHEIRQEFLQTSLSDEEKNAVLKRIQRLADADITKELEPDEEDAS